MITQNQIDDIVRILVNECHPEQIILFGSYALGTAKEDSDLDLAIVKSSDLPRFKRSALFRKALRADGRRWLFPMDIASFLFTLQKQIIVFQNELEFLRNLQLKLS